jgi:hypothetical protein
MATIDSDRERLFAKECDAFLPNFANDARRIKLPPPPPSSSSVASERSAARISSSEIVNDATLPLDDLRS